MIEKIKAELLGGPKCGDRLELYPFVDAVGSSDGKYILKNEKTKAGRVIFRWVANRKEAANG